MQFWANVGLICKFHFHLAPNVGEIWRKWNPSGSKTNKKSWKNLVPQQVRLKKKILYNSLIPHQFPTQKPWKNVQLSDDSEYDGT